MSTDARRRRDRAGLLQLLWSTTGIDRTVPSSADELWATGANRTPRSGYRPRDRHPHDAVADALGGIAPALAGLASCRHMLRPIDEALLRLALRSDEAVEDTWRGVRDRVLTTYDGGVRQLLPLVHRRLVEAGLDGSDVAAVGQTVRETWLRNQSLFRDVEAALGVLDLAEVGHLALKGVPLAIACYPAVSLRPMADFDVLVAPESATTAIAALHGAGWEIESELHRDYVDRMSEVLCRAPGGGSALDLHWRVVPWLGRSWSAPDPELWAAATPLEVGRRTTLAPAPDDLLLHVLLHGYRSGWDQVPRWVADAVMVLRSTGPSFDWDRFTRRVIGSHLALPVAQGLRYIAETVAEDIPARVVGAFAEAPSTRRERRKHGRALRVITDERHWLTGEAASLRTDWSRVTVSYGRRAELGAMLPFLRGRLRVDRLWTFPFVVVRRRLQRRRRAAP